MSKHELFIPAHHQDSPKWLDRRWRWYLPPQLSPTNRKVLLHHALKTYGSNCHWCGVRTTLPQNSRLRKTDRTLEHLRPRAMGGLDTFENTRIACHGCNGGSSHMQAFETWLYRLSIMAPNRIFGTYIIGEDAV